VDGRTTTFGLFSTIQIQDENQSFLYREASRISLSYGIINDRTTLLVTSGMKVNLAIAERLSAPKGPDDNRIILRKAARLYKIVFAIQEHQRLGPNVWYAAWLWRISWASSIANSMITQRPAGALGMFCQFACIISPTLQRNPMPLITSREAMFETLLLTFRKARHRQRRVGFL
jgi:hypothetical protein